MNTRSFLSQFLRRQTACRADLFLIALDWSKLAYLVEFLDAAHVSVCRNRNRR